MSLRGSEATEAISQRIDISEIATLPAVARNDRKEYYRVESRLSDDGLDSEKTFSELSGFYDEFNLRSVFINFCAYRGGTIGTKIFVFIPFG